MGKVGERRSTKDPPHTHTLGIQVKTSLYLDCLNHSIIQCRWASLPFNTAQSMHQVWEGKTRFSKVSFFKGKEKKYGKESNDRWLYSIITTRWLSWEWRERVWLEPWMRILQPVTSLCSVMMTNSQRMTFSPPQIHLISFQNHLILWNLR